MRVGTASLPYLFLAISTESRHGAGDQIAGHIINFGCSL